MNADEPNFLMMIFSWCFLSYWDWGVWCVASWGGLLWVPVVGREKGQDIGEYASS